MYFAIPEGLLAGGYVCPFEMNLPIFRESNICICTRVCPSNDPKEQVTGGGPRNSSLLPAPAPCGR